MWSYRAYSHGVTFFVGNLSRHVGVPHFRTWRDILSQIMWTRSIPTWKKRYLGKISCVGIDSVLIIPDKTYDPRCLSPVECMNLLSFLVLDTSYYRTLQIRDGSETLKLRKRLFIIREKFKTRHRIRTLFSFIQTGRLNLPGTKSYSIICSHFFLKIRNFEFRVERTNLRLIEVVEGLWSSLGFTTRGPRLCSFSLRLQFILQRLLTTTLLLYSGAPNENIAQKHLNIALLNVF